MGIAGLIGLPAGHDRPDDAGHLFAMATLAKRAGLRASNAIRRGSAVSGLCLARRINEVVPITRSCPRTSIVLRARNFAFKFSQCAARWQFP